MKKLIGLTINKKLITDKTSRKHWCGDFRCSDNQLTSLEGAPASVSGDFICRYNKLTSLEGAPSSVGGDFWCFDNKLTSLSGIHKILKQIKCTFWVDDNPLKSNVIGLLLVKGCREVIMDNIQVQDIMNKHLQSPFGNLRVLECQSEMLEAELGDWAKL